MTGRFLNVNPDRFNQGAVNRDMQIAQDFSAMAEMGYLDKEFTMYGAAYLGIDDEMKYIISSKQDEIFRFSEMSAYHQICPSPVRCYAEICPVPSGYEEDIAQQVKFRLAKRLQQDYKKPLFESLNHFAQIDGNDAAYDLLFEEQEKIEGLFDRDTLAIFEGLVDLAYQKKLLSQRSLNEFTKWMKKIKQQMEDDLVIRDILEKTFYGYAYRIQNGRLKYIINAQHETIFASVLKAQDQGYRPSPIFNKTYYYNYKYTLDDVRNDFNQRIKTLLDEEYIEKISALYEMPSGINSQEFENLMDSYKEKDDHYAIEILDYFGNKWNVRV